MSGIKGEQIRDDSIKGVDVDEATLRLPLITITEAGTTDLNADTHHTVIVNVNDPDSANIRLPGASGSPGKIFIVKKIGSGEVSISSVSGNIDGESAWPLMAAGEGATLQSDGTNWWVVSQTSPEDMGIFSNAQNAVSINDAVYISSNGTVSKALASSSRTCAIGVVSEIISSTSCRVLTSGIIHGFSSGMTAGDYHYLSPTSAGGLTTTKPGTPYIRQIVGVASNSTDLLVVPSVGQLNLPGALNYELYNQSQGANGISGWWQKSSDSYCGSVATTSAVGDIPSGYYVIAFDGTGDPVSLYNHGQSFFSPVRLSFKCQNGGGGSWPLPSGNNSSAFESGEFLYIQTSTDGQTWTTLGTTMYRSTDGGVSYSATGTAGAIQGTEVSNSNWYDFYIEVMPGYSMEDYPYYMRFYFDVGHNTDDCAIADVQFQFNPADILQTIPVFPSSSAGKLVSVGPYGELSDNTGVYYDTTYGAAINFDGNNIDLNGGNIKDGALNLLSHNNSKVQFLTSIDLGVNQIMSGSQLLLGYTSGTDTVELGQSVSDTVKVWGGMQTMGHTTLGQSSSYNTTVKGDLTTEGSIINSGVTAGGSAFATFDTSNDTLHYYSSTEKIKNNIQPHSKGLDTLNAIRPTSFDMKNGETDCLGFIAEEVHAADEALSTLGPDFDYNESGEPKRDENGKKVLLSEGLVPVSWDLPAMISVLVKSVQELSAKVEALEATVDELSDE